MGRGSLLFNRPTLEETNALLEATLESTHDGILVVSLEHRILLYNRQFTEFFQLPPEATAPGGEDLLVAAILDRLEDPATFVLSAPELWMDPAAESRSVVRFKDGRVFEQFVAPQRIRSTVVGIVASYRDISRSARTEKALERHRAFLEKAQEVAHIGSWVAELDGSGALGWSKETHHIFGVEAGEFAGTSERFYQFVHADDLDMVRAASEAAISAGLRYDVEHRIVRADGTVRWVQERADVIRDTRGHAIRMIGTVQDITERRLLEEQLRQAQKMDAIGRLAGGIAHDLNNALTAMAGYAELALGALSTDHPARNDVDEIRKAAERAGSVTRQLLAFSRKELLEPRVFGLNETVANLGRMLGRLLGENVHLRVETTALLPPIQGDPGQVEQAIVNLAVNARDAMPNGGQLTLTTALEEVDEAFARAHVPMAPGRYVVLSVGDTGHGMTAETRARIFEPFFTTKDVGKGTGLGLSMVYGTLKQSGGFIYVESEVGHGTTFRLYFPPARAVAPTAGDRGEVKAPGTATETLLIVEDEPAVRALVCTTLTHEGYRILQAASADEALKVAAAHPQIDLLLTDAIMPGISGIELAHMLMVERPGLPVIIMSGYTEDALSISGLPAPVSVLQKPFMPRELRERIRQILHR